MKLFLSYAARDAEFVALLHQDLEEFGHDVWRDVKIIGGQDWWDEICNRLRASVEMCGSDAQDAYGYLQRLERLTRRVS